MATDAVSDLLFGFQQMQADDHEVLIRRFCELIPGSVPNNATFYLESFNWNLQAALNAWFEYGGAVVLPQARFVQDITIGEGESVPPNNEFTKTWRLENNGDTDWPAGCSLQYVSGDKLTNQTQIPVTPLIAGSQTDVSVDMMSPAENGQYCTKWSLVTARGAHFGEPIWSIIQVEEGGTLTLTQMIDRM